RIDRQVKVRGFRIEMGEIEAVLNQHRSVKESVVIIRGEGATTKTLVAYLVKEAGEAVTEKELRTYVKERLPEYMEPTAFVVIEQMPLTANGKVDRRALPEPELNRAERELQYEAARTPVEEMIAEIWGEVLKQPRVGVKDNFFELGGHSLLATQVMSRLRQALRVEVALRKLFEEPTVEALAREVERQWKTERQLRQGEVKKLRRGGPMEVSVVQR